MTEHDSAPFALVRNTDAALSLWPTARPLPSGWQPAGFRGTRDACLAHADTTATATEPHVPAGAPGSPGTLVALFRETARRHPDRPAVTDDETTLTYAELDALSDRIAAALLARGAGPEQRVAYTLGRGAPVFVTLLGILKSGAAYVPVDTRYPDARRALMLSESRPTLVVTDPGRGAEVAADVDVWEYDPEEAPEALAALPEVHPANAASVLFTSGSSGTPKGVVLEHRNLVHFATNPSLPALTERDRVGHVSSLSFDAFHFETWCAFAAGAEIAVLPTMPDLLAGDLGRELRRRRVTAMLVPTMALNHVVAEDRETFATLRVLHTGGDVVLPETCRQLLKSSFTGQLHNLYGPTEGTTACSAHHVTEVADSEDSVPIGRALAGTTLHVLDAALDPVPDGTAGELHLTGPGVARGYLGKPGLTAERFLPDPYAAGGRMYATGDLVRREADGTLRYLGRADDQVKIRGYRVEPREVERQLSRHPQLRDVAVLAAGTGSDRHLLALVVPHDELSMKELRAYAEQALPDFMVPSSLVRVAEIPANDHGKRDNGRLAALVEEHLRHRAEHVPPRDETEAYLAELWSELLSVEEIGAQDDFFALGGNSLLAFRMQRRLVRQLAVEISAREILTTSELGALARVIRARREESVTA